MLDRIGGVSQPKFHLAPPFRRVWFIPRLSIGSWRFIGWGRRRRGCLVTGAVSDVAGARPVRQYAGVAVEFVADDDVELADGL